MKYKTRHPLYNTYRNMKARCYNDKAPNYKWYGAMGITVCDRWTNSFQSFIDDMGPKPDGCVLIRKDATKGYEPSNCQWGPKGSEDRREVVEEAPPESPAPEYALMMGEKVSKPLPSLEQAQAQRDHLVAEAMKAGRRMVLQVVQKVGEKWEVVPETHGAPEPPATI